MINRVTRRPRIKKEGRLKLESTVLGIFNFGNCRIDIHVSSFASYANF